MRDVLILALAVLAFDVGVAPAQSQPYAPLKDRTIKSLSNDDVENLRAGRGMGMALPAELNRYPGPVHVLENETALQLTVDQKAAIQRQFDEMHADAVALGEQIIAREATLDRLFQSGTADTLSIDKATAEVAALYGQLRAVHLRTHLATRATLTDAQLAAYQTVRGYDASGATMHHQHRQ